MNFLLIILVLLGTPALSLFIFKCYDSGMIFRRFYVWLNYWWIKWRRKENRWKRKFLKLFMCFYCYNTWLTIVFYLVLLLSGVVVFEPLWIGFLFLLPVLGLSYIILEGYIKILKLWE